tara:strand:- start:7619 stop:7957 length:339 start_codon:yes stop_codon:yes gene_type:complete
MKITYNKKKINIPVKKVSKLRKITGLMFRKRITNNLLFLFNKSSNMNIHSYFVFFNFLAIWTDNKNNVIDKKIVKPFTLSVKPKKSFHKLIEIPINEKNEKIIHFFVGGRKI